MGIFGIHILYPPLLTRDVAFDIIVFTVANMMCMCVYYCVYVCVCWLSLIMWKVIPCTYIIYLYFIAYYANCILTGLSSSSS